MPNPAAIALPKERPVGRPPFEPTPEHREMVERAAGLGFTQEKIAALIGTTKPTLEKHLREGIERGRAVTQFKVGTSAVENALSGNGAAQSWYTKSQMSWRDARVTETRETGYESMPAEGLAREHEERANALGL